MSNLLLNSLGCEKQNLVTEYIYMLINMHLKIFFL